MDTLREILEILRTDIYVGKSRAANIRIMEKMLLILMSITAVMSLINLTGSSVILEVTSLMLFIGFTFCFVLLKKYENRRIVILLFSLIMVVIFTYYFIFGSSNGFACLWLIVFPYAAMSVIDLKWGLYSSAYFFLLSVFFFWTPAKQFLQYEYSETFMIRFPILYFFSMLVAIRTGYQLHRASLEQLTRIDDLHKAVEVEREKNLSLAMQTIISISQAVDAKDSYTSEHSARVAQYAKTIASELGWSEEKLERLYIAGLIHDIGKIGIPDAILNKPGKLTDEEFAQIKMHPEIGHKILKGYDALEGVTDSVLCHHERYDGNGYPTGLKGESIPVFARIIAVADAYDAMSSNRVYRRALNDSFILEQLETGKGKQFDPQFADILLRLIKEGKIK